MSSVSPEAGHDLLYPRGVITHGGTSTVAGFITEIERAKDEIQKIEPLLVVTGYHGGDVGEFHQSFDLVELRAVGSCAREHFPNAVVKIYQASQGRSLTPAVLPGFGVLVGRKECDDREILDLCEKGNVFFTWCQSDLRVKRVVGESTLGTGRGIG